MWVDTTRSWDVPPTIFNSIVISSGHKNIGMGLGLGKQTLYSRIYTGLDNFFCSEILVVDNFNNY